ncbi:MAG TPA: YHS domain-containing (seleno)protein [Thermoanaerobaculia bacterium]
MHLLRRRRSSSPRRNSTRRQYGGYCAWAVSRNYTADADPQAWKIVGGKLYLNYNAKVQSAWSEDVPANIEKADANWPKLLEKSGD